MLTGTQENRLDETVLLSTKSNVWVIITKAKAGCDHHQGSNTKLFDQAKHMFRYICSTRTLSRRGGSFEDQFKFMGKHILS